MKKALVIPCILVGKLAMAAGAASSTGDVLAYGMVLAFLTFLLGLVYLFEFVNRVRKDDDFRNQLKARISYKIKLVRSIFIEGKEEDQRSIEKMSGLGLEGLIGSPA